MGNIINISDRRKTGNEGIMEVFPTKEEVDALNRMFFEEGFKQGEVVGVEIWNGDCWKVFFHNMKVEAEKRGIKPWDAFAVFMAKIHGTEL